MQLNKGNIISDNGDVLFFSIENFISHICKSNNCFICGKSEDEKQFNDEHIIPRWILKRFKLFDKKITLPNKVPFMYGRYVIKCCAECNTLLGKRIETIVSKGLTEDYAESLVFFKKNKELLFVWLCLLITKTHLKDNFFNSFPRNSVKIGEMYDWEILHHIHCVARSAYTGCRLTSPVIGTMLLLPCYENDQLDSFDYMDKFIAGVVCVRLGSYFILAVLNDGGLVEKLLKPRLDRITGPLQMIQIRELFARACEANMRITERPRFLTVKLKDKNELYIVTDSDKYFTSSFRPDILGVFMFDLIDKLILSSEHPEFGDEMKMQREAIKNGEWTYLFDENGVFLDNNIKILGEN